MGSRDFERGNRNRQQTGNINLLCVCRGLVWVGLGFAALNQTFGPATQAWRHHEDLGDSGTEKSCMALSLLIFLKC